MTVAVFMKYASLILLGGFTLVALLIPIVDSVIIGGKTGEWKPLADATIGQFVGSQAVIKQDINYIKEHPSEDSTLIQIRKERIGKSLFISLLILLITYFVIFKIISFGMQGGNSATHLVAVGLALFLLYFGNLLYMGYSYGKWDFVPFCGFVELAKNFNILWEVVGIYEPMMNASIGG